jgi:hypothetical protein
MTKEELLDRLKAEGAPAAGLEAIRAVWAEVARLGAELNLQAEARPGQVWEHRHANAAGEQSIVCLVLEGAPQRSPLADGMLEFPCAVIGGGGPVPRLEAHRVGWGKAWKRLA